MGADARRRGDECTAVGAHLLAPNLNDVVQRPPAGTIPDAPGSYQFKDAEGRVIYVGKAASLRQRLSNYFGARGALAPVEKELLASLKVGTVTLLDVRPGMSLRSAISRVPLTSRSMR